jgi:membrane fusion protein (multidrug efflux system)
MNIRLLSALSLLVILVACGTGSKPAGSPGGSPGGPAHVSVVTIQPESVTLTSRLPGRTAAFRVADIRPQVNGLIHKRLFTEGSDIAAGQVLYQLDPAPFQAALDNARAALARAEASRVSVKARAERFTTLVKDQTVSQQDYDDATANLAQVEAEIISWKAQVEAARINLGYTAITAPIAGRIGRSAVTEGAIVIAYQAQALATIQQFDPIYVDAPQSTADLLRIRRAMEAGQLRDTGGTLAGVGLTLDDGSRYPQEGEMRFRDVAVNPTTGAVAVRMVFPNPQGLLLPEMFVRAEIGEGVNDHALLVLQQSVMRNPKGEPYVFLVDGEGKATRQMIGIEREVGNRWLVTTGLAAGDRVVVEGVQALQMMPPGAPMLVNATPFVAPDAPVSAGTDAAAPAPAAVPARSAK